MDRKLPCAATDSDHIRRAYAFWAPIYDMVFSTLLAPGRRVGAELAQQGGGLVLSVGVGTGLELPMFNPDIGIVGIDLSPAMLARAQRRVDRLGLRNVHGLLAMDAARTAFADATFDAAFAPYVLTVVADPVATLDELVRVVKPGAEIVLVNHIGAEAGVARWFENCLGSRAAQLGWRANFSWSIIADWLSHRSDVALLERRTVPPLGLFTLMRMQRTG